MADRIFRLKAGCNNYPWGKRGDQSMAARFCASAPGTDFMIDPNERYSEMWLGVYPKLPSHLSKTGEALEAVLNREPDKFVGKQVTERFGTPIPYLMKILSVDKCLPLQLHPNKDLAKKLHNEDSSSYTDANHKPEIAIAISKFEAFCGFKPLDRIDRLLTLEPLRRFRRTRPLNDDTLREVVRDMLTTPARDITTIGERLKALSSEELGEENHIPELLPRLWDQYGTEDPGALVTLVTMNYVTLQPGECIYIPADGIHAWLSGDLLECMASSDNVLNVGFCPPDQRNSADLFCRTVTNAPHSEGEARLTLKPWKMSKSGKTKQYAPPLDEFAVAMTDLGAGEKDDVMGVNGPSLFLVTNGRGRLQADGESWTLHAGAAFFIGRGTTVEISADEPLRAFRAFVECT